MHVQLKVWYAACWTIAPSFIGDIGHGVGLQELMCLESLWCILASIVYRSRLVLQSLGQSLPIRLPFLQISFLNYYHDMFIQEITAHACYIELSQCFDMIQSECTTIFGRFTLDAALTLTSKTANGHTIIVGKKYKWHKIDQTFQIWHT